MAEENPSSHPEGSDNTMNADGTVVSDSMADNRPYGVSKDDIRGIRDALDIGDTETARCATTDFHAADQAYILDMLSGEQRQQLLDVLADDFDPHILSHLDIDVTEEVVAHLGPDATAEMLGGLETDEAVSILEDFEEADQQQILQAFPEQNRDMLEEGLSYPEGSAGRLMRKKMVLAPHYWTVGNVIDYLRKHEQLPDDFYSIFVVDARGRPVGSVLLSRIIRAQRKERVESLMTPGPHTIPLNMDQEEVAHLFKKYGMASAPVVSEQGRIHGMITIDDIADVIEEEADEDLLRMGGVGESDLFSALHETVRRRFPWLFINLLTAIMASLVIAQFDDAIDQMVALAVLMPIIASMGGNAGTQTVTVAVRAIATRELTDVNAWRVVGKETLVGFVNGLAFAIITGVAVLLWYQDITLAMVFALATVATLTVAGCSGALIPLGLARMGADPAISSSVFLTTVTDVIGFLAFLGIAAMILLS